VTVTAFVALPHIALLDCLHKNRGHVVSYMQLGLILGHKSFRKPQRHVLRQYVSWISKTLAAHKALCILAVAPDIGQCFAHMSNSAARFHGAEGGGGYSAWDTRKTALKIQEQQQLPDEQRVSKAVPSPEELDAIWAQWRTRGLPEWGTP
jgi:hypothetical protein